MFINYIKSMIEIQFVSPETVIVAQGEDINNNDCMFFLEKGECEVKVRDKQKLRNTDKTVRQLYPGDFFGEIAMIYRERRSTSVVSSNYTTLGKISTFKMNEAFAKFPDLKTFMIERIKEYDDNLKIFFERALCSIDYLQGVQSEVMNELIFSFIPVHYEKGSIIFK